MLYQNQLSTDFRIKVLEIQSDYLKNGKFVISEEDFPETKCVIITDGLKTTKLLYNKEQKVAIINTIFKSDIELIQKLTKELEG